MSTAKEFKKLGRKTYLGYHQDGIIDIILGLCTLGFGIRMATETPVFLFLSWIPILFYIPLKNRITVPRYGYVRFTSDRSRSVIYALTIVVGIVLFAFFFGLYMFRVSDGIPPAIDLWLKEYHMVLLGGIAGITISGAAFFTGIHRFYGYALLFIAVPLIGVLLGIPEPTSVILLGAIIFLIGAWMLYRFLSTHPIIEEEQSDVIE